MIRARAILHFTIQLKEFRHEPEEGNFAKLVK